MQFHTQQKKIESIYLFMRIKLIMKLMAHSIEINDVMNLVMKMKNLRKQNDF